MGTSRTADAAAAAALLDQQPATSTLPDLEETSRAADTDAALHGLKTVSFLLPRPGETSRAANTDATLLNLETVTSTLPGLEMTT
jgi:hypothetical protein